MNITSIVNERDGKWNLPADLIEERLLQRCDKQQATTNYSIIARNLENLFHMDYEVAFIMRYRAEMVWPLNVDDVRFAKRVYDTAKDVKAHVTNISRKLDNVVTDKAQMIHLKLALERCKSVADVDAIYGPFKRAKQGTLADRGRQLGLQFVSDAFFSGQMLHFDDFVDQNRKGLRDINEVENSTLHIISEQIYKDVDTQFFIKNISNPANIADTGNNKRGSRITLFVQTTAKVLEGCPLYDKYKDYMNYNRNINNIKNFHVLALQRAEKQTALTWKVDCSDVSVECAFKTFLHDRFRSIIRFGNIRVLEESSFHHRVFKSCFLKQIRPAIERSARKVLVERAVAESIDCFAWNLRGLLLMAPIKNTFVLAVDPGFDKGCKVALISQSGNVLRVDTFNLNWKCSEIEEFFKTVVADISKKSRRAEEQLKIAVGNGHGCRQTEKLIAAMISDGVFQPFQAEYCIVSECGSSVYSASALAAKELPDIPLILRSAVSIARRLQDPLAEYIKIEPRHLGIGMYQHDANEGTLKNVLNDVVREVVTTVGVDANTCSFEALKHVAGLDERTARSIIEYRERNGWIKSRSQLKSIKWIGPKVFERCSGFINVYPQLKHYGKEVAQGGTRKRRSSDTDYTPLDATMVHPESYKVAQLILDCVTCTVYDVGSEKLQKKLYETDVISAMVNLAEVRAEIAEACHGKAGTACLPDGACCRRFISLIIDQISKPLHYDIRTIGGRVFSKAYKSVDDLKSGLVLTGMVTNVTDIGVFVDIGVGSHGLVPQSTINYKSLERYTIAQVGNLIKVTVIDINRKNGKITLRLNSIEQKSVIGSC